MFAGEFTFSWKEADLRTERSFENYDKKDFLNFFQFKGYTVNLLDSLQGSES